MPQIIYNPIHIHTALRIAPHPLRIKRLPEPTIPHRQDLRHKQQINQRHDNEQANQARNDGPAGAIAVGHARNPRRQAREPREREAEPGELEAGQGGREAGQALRQPRAHAGPPGGVVVRGLRVQHLHLLHLAPQRRAVSVFVAARHLGQLQLVAVHARPHRLHRRRLVVAIAPPRRAPRPAVVAAAAAVAQQALPLGIVADFFGPQAGLLRGGAGRGGLLVRRDGQVVVDVVEVLLVDHWSLGGLGDARSLCADSRRNCEGGRGRCWWFKD